MFVYLSLICTQNVFDPLLYNLTLLKNYCLDDFKLNKQVNAKNIRILTPFKLI